MSLDRPRAQSGGGVQTPVVLARDALSPSSAATVVQVDTGQAPVETPVDVQDQQMTSVHVRLGGPR